MRIVHALNQNVNRIMADPDAYKRMTSSGDDHAACTEGRFCRAIESTLQKAGIAIRAIRSQKNGGVTS